MLQLFLDLLHEAEENFYKYYCDICNSYYFIFKFMVDGINDDLVHIIVESFPREKNSPLLESPLVKKIFGELPADLESTKEIICYCFENFDNGNISSITPIVPYATYSSFLKNGGVTAENFNNIIDDCISNNDFSIMKDGFGLRICFSAKK